MNAQIKLITNRQFPDVAAESAELVPGARLWAQIEVSGEHQVNDGRTMVVDEEARRAIVDAFRGDAAREDFPGLLIDADHLSHDLNQRTEAYAWLKDVEDRDGQLWGELQLTGKGAPAIANKDYLFFSTEYDVEGQQDLGNGRVRPIKLTGLALTNRPKIKGGKPITNRAESDDSSAESTNQPEISKMKNIATKLGLEEGATEEAILNRVDEIQNENTMLRKEKSEAEADAILNRYADRLNLPEDATAAQAVRDGWRANLIANREGTEQILKSLPEPKVTEPEKKPEPRQPITNRETAKSPEDSAIEGGGDDSQKQKDDARYREIRNRATAIANEKGIPFGQAWDQARDTVDAGAKS